MYSWHFCCRLSTCGDGQVMSSSWLFRWCLRFRINWWAGYPELATFICLRIQIWLLIEGMVNSNEHSFLTSVEYKYCFACCWMLLLLQVWVWVLISGGQVSNDEFLSHWMLLLSPKSSNRYNESISTYVEHSHPLIPPPVAIIIQYQLLSNSTSS